MSRCDNWKENSDQARRDWKESQDEKCVEWADEGSEKCSEWADEGSEKCSEWADEGSEKCKAWEECKWYTPWNCIAGFFCKAYYWVSNWVCKAYYWVSNWVCKAYYWVSKWVCKAWSTVGNFGWWAGIRIGWIGCVVYDAVIKPIVDWILEAFGVCTSRRKVSDVTRLTPSAPSDIPESVIEFKSGRRMILCLDGGGVRGIVTLQALKSLEDETGGKCIDIFDMFAGTSTGAIIAGALAWGVSVDDLIKLYHEKHKIIFSRSKKWVATTAGGAAAGAGLGALIGGPLGAVIGGTLGAVGGYFGSRSGLIVPKYDNKALICILKSIFGDDTLAHCHRDLFITSKDTVRTETTYFTAFHPSPRPRDEKKMEDWLKNVRGTYKDVALASAIAASAGSAPIYFKPVGRFLDGGVGSFNNVSYAAPVEALRYSAEKVIIGRFNDEGKNDPNGQWPVYDHPEHDQLYKPGKVGVISFGTGKEVTNMEVNEAMKIKTALGWIGWILGELMDDADEQQSYIEKKDLDGFQDIIQFRRFQIHWSQRTIDILRQVNNDLGLNLDLPSELKNGSKFKLDAVKEFELLDKLGQTFGEWLRQPREGENTVRFRLLENITLGHPVRSNPPRYHIDVYSEEVKKELTEQVS